MRTRTASPRFAVALHFLHQAAARLIPSQTATPAFVDGPLCGVDDFRSPRNIRAKLRRRSGLRHAAVHESARADLTRQAGARAQPPDPLVDALGTFLAGTECLTFLLRCRSGFHPFFLVLIEVDEANDAERD